VANLTEKKKGFVTPTKSFLLKMEQRFFFCNGSSMFSFINRASVAIAVFFVAATMNCNYCAEFVCCYKTGFTVKNNLT